MQPNEANHVGTGSTQVIPVALNHHVCGDTSWMNALCPITPVKQTVYIAKLLASVY